MKVELSWIFMKVSVLIVVSPRMLLSGHYHTTEITLRSQHYIQEHSEDFIQTLKQGGKSMWDGHCANYHAISRWCNLVIFSFVKKYKIVKQAKGKSCVCV